MENLTKTYGVPLIVTEDTRLALRDPGAVSLRRIDRVLVEGKSQPVVLHEVLDAESPVIRRGKLTNRIPFDAGLACYEALEFEAAIGHFEHVSLCSLQTPSHASFCSERMPSQPAPRPLASPASRRTN